MLNLSREQRDDFLFDVTVFRYEEREMFENCLRGRSSRDLDVERFFSSYVALFVHFEGI